MEGERLAVYRVSAPGGMEYWAKDMDAEERSIRRVFLRKKLLNTQWANMSNDELDSVRLYRLGDGYMFEDANGYETYLKDSGVSKAEADFRRVRAMMPFEFIDKTGKDFQWSYYKTDILGVKEQVNDFVRNYEKFREESMGLYISSATKGSGKTMLACCIANEITQRYSGSVKFVKTLDYLEMAKKNFKDENSEMESLFQASLLIIDDIGAQKATEWSDSVILRLVDDRCSNKRMTIYTSNVPVDDLKMDDRIVSRVEKTTWPLMLPEESIRKIIGQQQRDAIIQKIKSGPM